MLSALAPRLCCVVQVFEWLVQPDDSVCSVQVVSRQGAEWLFTLSVCFLLGVRAICFLRKFEVGRTVSEEIYSQVTFLFCSAFLYLVGIVRFMNLKGVCLSMRGNKYTL